MPTVSELDRLAFLSRFAEDAATLRVLAARAEVAAETWFDAAARRARAAPTRRLDGAYDAEIQRASAEDAVARGFDTVVAELRAIATAFDGTLQQAKRTVYDDLRQRESLLSQLRSAA